MNCKFWPTCVCACVCVTLAFFGHTHEQNSHNREKGLRSTMYYGQSESYDLKGNGCPFIQVQSAGPETPEEKELNSVM